MFAHSLVGHGGINSKHHGSILLSFGVYRGGLALFFSLGQTHGMTDWHEWDGTGLDWIGRYHSIIGIAIGVDEYFNVAFPRVYRFGCRYMIHTFLVHGICICMKGWVYYAQKIDNIHM